MPENRVIGGVLLIAGTAIGAGMLALPISTGSYGFISSSIAFLICWSFMTFAAFLMLEINLWLPKDSNLASMAQKTLGGFGTVTVWLFYLLLLYALLSAYLSGLGALFVDILKTIFQIHCPSWLGTIFFGVLGALILYVGVKSMDVLNRFLMIGLIGTFIAMTVGLFPYSDPSTMVSQSNKSICNTLPIIFVTFGFQIIIPSLRTYLQSNIRKLRSVILLGSLIPLIIYLIWEFLILSIIPLTGEDGILAILASGQPEIGLTHSLSNILQTNWIALGFRSFAAFAIATSFLGVSLSLFDFLGDSLNLEKRNLHGRLSVLAATFLPPLFFAIAYPRGFILALEYAGVFVAILLVFLPGLMAWKGRYGKNSFPKTYRVPGGKLSLIALMLFGSFVIWIELQK